jgi:hypothetical protein
MCHTRYLIATVFKGWYWSSHSLAESSECFQVSLIRSFSLKLRAKCKASSGMGRAETEAIMTEAKAESKEERIMLT